MIRPSDVSTLGNVSAPAADLLEFERGLIERGETVVGLDEVGRGALAGPLTVGAVVIRTVTAAPEGLNDSKLLSRQRRESLVGPLEQWAYAWSLGSTTAAEIDRWGLRLALAVAATRALEGLAVMPTHALIDGPFNLLSSPLSGPFGVTPPLRFAALPMTTIVGGDQRCATIAAASVLAKVHRDRFMVSLHEGHREYCWASNKGYAVPEHLDAIRRCGASSHHRQTWHLPEIESTSLSA